MTELEKQWMVGADCQAVWEEDGQLYPAKVVSLNGGRCRVRFHGLGVEEEVELSALQSPDAAVQPQRQNSQNWRAGSRCQAISSGSGLVYPAVVLWVRGQRCCVRCDSCNYEEELDVCSLLGRRKARRAKRASRRRPTVIINSDLKRKRRENQEEGGAERRREKNQEEGGAERREENQEEQRGGRRTRRKEEQRGGRRTRREENQEEQRGGRRTRRSREEGGEPGGSSSGMRS